MPADHLQTVRDTHPGALQYDGEPGDRKHNENASRAIAGSCCTCTGQLCDFEFSKLPVSSTTNPTISLQLGGPPQTSSRRRRRRRETNASRRHTRRPFIHESVCIVLAPSYFMGLTVSGPPRTGLFDNLVVIHVNSKATIAETSQSEMQEQCIHTLYSL